MSRKHRQQGSRRGSKDPADLHSEFQRHMQAGRYKDALKEAKILYRDASTPENHRLVERAYLSRTQQLQREGMPAAAAEVAGHLLEFGVTDRELIENLVLLLPALGLGDKAHVLAGRIDSPQMQELLLVRLADQAVLHPEKTPASKPELRAGGMQIREALQALEAGNEERAWELLRDIPRGSPFADWRLFVRGLAAHRRGESAQVEANWDRLAPDRMAQRIARKLRSAQSAATGEPPPGGAPPRTGMQDWSLSVVETQVFGEPILPRLDQLRVVVARKEWSPAWRLLRPLQQSLKRIDPQLSERLTRVLVSAVLDAARDSEGSFNFDLIQAFTRTAEPLAIDPQWNRFNALAWECVSYGEDEAERLWRMYLEELPTLEQFSPEERRQAQALVCRQIGAMLAMNSSRMDDDDEEDDDEYDDDPWLFGDEDDEEDDDPDRKESRRDDYRNRALGAMEESLRFDPGNLETHLTKFRMLQCWNEPEKAATAARWIAMSFPDAVEAPQYLAEFHLERLECQQALPYAQRAHELKPLNADLQRLEYRVQLGLVREQAQQERWSDARAALAQAARMADEVDTLQLQAVAAALEFRAGEDDQAQAILERSQKELGEPSPLWLAMLIETKRFPLPKVAQERFAHLWQRDLAKRCQAKSAGRMARLLLELFESKCDLPDRTEYIRSVVKYIKRTMRSQYQESDLIAVCRLLELAGDEWACLAKIARRGAKKFPASPVFLFYGVRGEVEGKPNFRRLSQWKADLEQALELAQRSSQTDEQSLIPKIKLHLGMVLDLIENQRHSPFPFPFSQEGSSQGLPDFQDILDELYRMFGREPADEEDDDEFPRRRRARSRSQR
ncbi:MAG: hypothetical protein ACKV0T_28595 [Planctomycetales bacterium]